MKDEEFIPAAKYHFLTSLFDFSCSVFGLGRRYRKRIVKSLDLPNKKIKVLDAGCGSGALTIYAAKRGNNAVGISFDKRNNDVAKERASLLGISTASFITYDLRKLDELSSKLGKFDQIICFETIE